MFYLNTQKNVKCYVRNNVNTLNEIRKIFN